MRLKKNKITEIAGQKVIIRQGRHAMDLTKIIALNTTALKICESFEDKDFDVDDVVDFLVLKYGLDKNKAREDAVSWITQCEGAYMIES